MDPSAGAPPPQGSAPPYGAPQPGMYPPQQPGMYPPQQGAPQQPYGAPSPYPPQGAPSPYPQQGAPSPYPQQGAPSPYPPGAMPPQGAPYGYPHQQSQPQFAPPPVVVQVVMPAVPGQIPPPQLGPISGYENVPPSVDSTPLLWFRKALPCAGAVADHANAGRDRCPRDPTIWQRRFPCRHRSFCPLARQSPRRCRFLSRTSFARAGAASPGRTPKHAGLTRCAVPLPHRTWRSLAGSYPAMNDTVAREAMRAYCKAHLTYSKDPAIGMTIGSVTPGVVYRVQLDTFMENRSVQWVIDSFPGRPARPWSHIPVDGRSSDCIFRASSVDLSPLRGKGARTSGTIAHRRHARGRP